MSVDLLRADSHLRLDQVDRNMRTALTAAARQAGPKAAGLMAEVLGRPPSRGGAGEAYRFFGSIELSVIIKAMDPMMFALNDGMPGFSAWLDRTGYGNDVGMIRALWAWCESDPDMREIVEQVNAARQALN